MDEEEEEEEDNNNNMVLVLLVWMMRRRRRRRMIIIIWGRGRAAGVSVSPSPHLLRGFSGASCVGPLPGQGPVPGPAGPRRAIYSHTRGEEELNGSVRVRRRRS